MRFFIVDVFAERKYQGNQLGVFVVDREMTAEEMQTIAAEMHFSESTFILSKEPRDGGFAVRIFTPDMEVPFAGHPTLGTAFVIRELLQLEPSTRVILNLGVGQIPVTFSGNKLTMEQKQPAFETIVEDREGIARILSIEESDLDQRFPIQVVSTGLPSVIIPLKTREGIGRCSVNHNLYKRFIEQTVKANLLMFAPEPENLENDLRVRVFVDDPGFFEDPATGSANGNLAGYLVEHNYFGKDHVRYRVEQGCEMGRASLLEVEAAKDGDQFTIRVGGKVFAVASGEWL